jgi:hypothetical protein
MRSFIFSFENNEDIKDMKISRIVKSSYVIYNYSGNGVVFGKGDLKLKYDCFSLSSSGTYEYLERNKYEVEEIEAFSVGETNKVVKLLDLATTFSTFLCKYEISFYLMDIILLDKFIKYYRFL